MVCRLPLVQAGRFWRHDVTTFVALERNWSSIKDSEFPPGFKVSHEYCSNLNSPLSVMSESGADSWSYAHMTCAFRNVSLVFMVLLQRALVESTCSRRCLLHSLRSQALSISWSGMCKGCGRKRWADLEARVAHSAGHWTCQAPLDQMCA